MAPKGFKFGAVEAAIKVAGKLDMGLILCEREASAAAVFTRNKVVAAPVILSRERVADGRARAVLVNSANANVCNGPRGMEDAKSLSAAAAKELGVAPEEVLVCSTGVIGQELPFARMNDAIPALCDSVDEEIAPFAASILTTDSGVKVSECAVMVDGEEVLVTGIAKGAGMIRPDMATMLAFIVTDAAVESAALQKLLSTSVERTFNRITVDGDTSTNDTVILMASGMSGAPALAEGVEGFEAFTEAVESICRDLSRMIVRDGEGATKLVDITVTGAADEASARKIAFTIAESPLVKTALHDEDPNWGRIAGALGRSPGYNGSPFDIHIGDVCIVKDCVSNWPDTEKAAHEVMCTDEYAITVALAEGSGEATVTTCDFSKDYISINADYRS
jgi:glutamate N-acetyltransferase/amino-acid N-acetyltransferase